MRVKGRCKNDQMVGQWTIWDVGGNIIAERDFSNSNSKWHYLDFKSKKFKNDEYLDDMFIHFLMGERPIPYVNDVRILNY